MDRCSWVSDDPLYQEYHDYEWGKPVYDDQKLYEMFLLETFQAGLSWITILHKREAFKEAFDDFDVFKVAYYDEKNLMDIKVVGTLGLTDDDVAAVKEIDGVQDAEGGH